jgi:hypothetical protein
MSGPLEAMRRPAVPTAAMLLTSCPFESGGGDHAFLSEALAHARDLGAVHHGAPDPARCTFSDVELDRIGAGVDHGKALKRAFIHD